MELTALLSTLFPAGADVACRGQLLIGSAQTARGPVAVLGTRDAAAIGVDLALDLAEGVLDVVARSPGRPIVFLVDTCGQALARHEELLGLNGYLAHLAACVDLARRQGHPSLSLVYGEAVSGGFLSFGLMADRTYALREAQVRVMDLKAMARVTKIPHERLVELAASSPIFAPGAENYVRMGGIEALWAEPSAALLEGALQELVAAGAGCLEDRRPRQGAVRGGRQLAAAIAAAVQAPTRNSATATATDAPSETAPSAAALAR